MSELNQLGSSSFNSTQMQQPLLEEPPIHDDDSLPSIPLDDRSIGSQSSTKYGSHDTALSPPNSATVHSDDPSTSVAHLPAGAAELSPTPPPLRVPQPPRAPWQRVADRAVRGFERRKKRTLRRADWAWTLAFPNEQQERIFSWYFAQLRERNMRGGMLVLVFMYIIYATVEWHDESSYGLMISRGIYVALVLIFYIYSYVKPRDFRLNIQEWLMGICLFTSLNILLEAALLNAVYSPFVVIIILLFLLSSSVIVRLRFVHTSVVCWSTILLYDLICMIKFRTGDSTIDGGKTVISWLAWYNIVLIFTIFTVMKISHRVEVQSRYEFLTTTMWTERKHRERKQKRKEEVTQALQEQYAIGAGGATTTTSSTDSESKQSNPATLPTPAALPSATVTPMSAAVAPAPAFSPVIGGNSSDSDWSSDDDADGGELDEASETALLGLDTDLDGEVNSTLHKINAGLQKRLHDLFFAQQPARQRDTGRSASKIEREAIDALLVDPTRLAADEEQPPLSASQSYSNVYVASAPATSSHLADDGHAHHAHGGAHGHTHHKSPHRRGSDTLRSRLGSRTSDAPGGGPVATVEPADIMTQITSALTESGVSDMGAFLQLLGSRPEAHRRRSEYGYVSVENLPKYFLSYPHIQGYYRANFSSRMCWQSLFKWHNETLNIWSEFLPALFFFIVFWYVMWADDILLSASVTDRIFVAVGLVGALILRPICSGLAHTFYCQNERAYVLWWAVDYASICVSILCTCLVFGRFTFACLPEQQSFFYVSLIGLFLSTIISVLFVSSNGVRTGSFLLFVLFATGVPFFYAVTLKLAGSSSNAVPSNYFYMWVGSLGCFFVGLIFKSTSFPECCTAVQGCAQKGAFDLFCASHLWWHICINVGNMMIYFIWREYLTWRQQNQC